MSKNLNNSNEELNESSKKKFKSDENGENFEDNIENEEIEVDEEDKLELSNESNYGIKQKINENYPRFRGILKEKPSDFIVNEVDLEGNVVRLTKFDLPIVENSLPSSENNEEFDKTKEILKKSIGEDVLEKIINYLASNDKNQPFQFEAPKEKSDRKLIHDFIKTYFDQFVTNTIQKNKETQLIEISHIRYHRATSRDTFKNNQRNKEMGESKFCVCVLFKENIDTIQAVNLIAKHLRINSKRIGYSGTKDKKAKTSQLLSFFRIEPKQIARLNNNFHNIKLGNFKLCNEGLKLGDLSGNRFKIVLRELSETNDDTIKQGLESLKKSGFINYFGLQRFGNCIEVPTHMIGKYLILNKIKEAIDLILKPREIKFEKEEVKKAREIWNSTFDANRAFFHVEKVNCIEKFLLSGLAKSGKNDYLGAFQFIPRNMRLMYLHAYQSFIWNEATSKRIELFGLKPCVGDLVRNKNSSEKEVILLTEQNLNEFSIEDIVLPLPGHNVLLPNNQLKEFYSDLLAKDGLNIESFKNKIKDFSLSGDYRNIVVKPKDMNYEIINYVDKSQDLTKSDWDLINPNYTEQIDKNQKNETDRALKGICLEYTLPTSAYATMALREILIESK